MIELKFKSDFNKIKNVFVGKLLSKKEINEKNDLYNKNESFLVQAEYNRKKNEYNCHSEFGNFKIFSDNENLYGDVFIFFPTKKYSLRVIRRSSNHNTILFTEKCDQLCVMCSQPPKNIESKWLFPLYQKAIELSDPKKTIGISGGEPTLYKKELFSILLNVYDKRKDLSFHILSNGQHFDNNDFEILDEINNKLNILWGIPLYADNFDLHDKIVKKKAFDILLKNLFILAETSSKIELRTVLMMSNYQNLPFLAKFISKNLNFVNVWAIMSLEQIGYAKVTKDEIFVDHSSFLKPLIDTLDLTILNGINTSLYNFPLCTIPEYYHQYCANSISDWKRKYLDICSSCSKKNICTGFFEWYNKDWKFNNLKAFK